MIKFVAAAQVAFWALGTLPALAHEFWIDLEQPGWAVGDTVTANLRVGENMKGGAQIYNPSRFTYFSVLTGEAALPIDGQIGDRPALAFETAEDGLHVFGHMTTASKLTYQSFEKFATFAQTHGETHAIAAHRARGLPEEDFTEGYFRCAKALVKVGSGAGADQIIGFPFELVALDNPYASEGPIRMQLLYKGRAKPDHQIDIFRKAPGAAEAGMSSLTSDENGVVEIPRNAGEFLINAVVLEEPPASIAERLGAVWVSLWASTTYVIE